MVILCATEDRPILYLSRPRHAENDLAGEGITSADIDCYTTHIDEYFAYLVAKAAQGGITLIVTSDLMWESWRTDSPEAQRWMDAEGGSFWQWYTK